MVGAAALNDVAFGYLALELADSTPDRASLDDHAAVEEREDAGGLEARDDHGPQRLRLAFRDGVAA